MYRQTQPIGHGANVIYKTDSGDKCQPTKKIWIGKTIKRNVHPYSQKENNSPTPQSYTRMRTSQIGLINDMFTERENDDYDGWNEGAGQADFDNF